MTPAAGQNRGMAHKDYSQVPLARKLGIKEGSLVVLDRPPAEAAALIGPLPAGAALTSAAAVGDGSVDVAIAFATELADLAEAVARLAPRLAPAGGLWLCSPKRASRIPTDIDFDRLQALGLDAGLVDNKVASISDVYTGVRFVRRLRDRR